RKIVGSVRCVLETAPSLGVELPNLVSYEPTFAREVEWTLLEGLRRCTDRQGGSATYLRLSTKPIAQHLLEPALQRFGEEQLRQQVLAGGYRLVEAGEEAPAALPEATVEIAAAGVMVPEAVEAARRLHREGVAANVLVITSADRLFAAYAAGRRRALQGKPARYGQLERLLPLAERRAPIVTVIDGASHSLSFLGSVFGAPLIPLGVDQFGQSGSRAALYRYYGIDPDAIVAAALAALDEVD
ncbi:MAG: pyruvate dehydrogenase, partial [Chloroflexi bacterium]|nr:pyruvate dehydrogenase [Chloroflexota bacterium]